MFVSWENLNIELNFWLLIWIQKKEKKKKKKKRIISDQTSVSLSHHSARDSNSANDPASDPSILQSVCLILFLQFFCLVPEKNGKIFLRKKILFLACTLHHLCMLMCISLLFSFLIGQVKKLYELCKAENLDDFIFY